MKKNICAIIIALIAICLFMEIADSSGYMLTIGNSGNSVRRLQQDLAYLGYFSGAATGYFGSQTKRAVKSFQTDNGLHIDGVAGPTTQNLLTRRVREKGTSLSSRRNDDAGLLPWEEVDRLWPRGTTYTVWDVRTHMCFRAWRLQGTFHVDAEPLTKADTAILLEACGGQWTSYRRPVLVEINGRLIAGSMYPYPHGNEAIHNNGFSGQFCIHFLGSRVHASGKVDSGHYAAMMEAAEAVRTWAPPVRNEAQPEMPVVEDNKVGTEQVTAAQ